MTTPVPDTTTDKIWFKNLQILVDVDRVSEFFPSSSQSLEERMNSIVRLGLYSSIITMIYKRDMSKISIFFVALCVTYYIYKKYENEDNEIEKLLMRTGGKLPDEKIKEILMKEEKDIKPTLNNPFMNVTIDDYTRNPNRKPAPEYYKDTEEASKTRDDVSKKFKNDLYMDINDVYEKNNSQRQFYTMPNTSIPSDQDKFLEFMYPNMTSCKVDSNDCKIAEDLRARPFIFPDQDENPITESII